MAADTVTPLCTWAQFTEGAFADLARNYTSVQAQTDLLVESTRLVEGMCGRRLAPFTGLTETHRAEGIDPDEYGNAADLPMDMSSALGKSFANAINAGELVRHCWVDEFAPRYPEMWGYANVSVTVVRSYGGSQTLTASQVTGPENDSGHLWFQLGLFVPVGSLVRVTYDGGFQSMPASLVRAGKFATASLIVRELQPTANTRDPNQLVEDAERCLDGFMRD